jgi:uncharacterized membrane protein (UPF0127 family)
MIHDLVYAFLVFLIIGLIYYRYYTVTQEGFYNNSGSVINLYVKTARDKNLGLMHRKEKLKENHGMLFDYNRYGIFTFWMKNTFIPLEIICLDHNYQVLGIIKKMKPHSTESRTLDKPFRYAVEVNRGTCRKNGITEGSYVKFIEVNTI